MENDLLMEDSLFKPSLCVASVRSPDSVPVVNELQRLVVNLNITALDFLEKKNYIQARRALLTAEKQLKQAKEVAITVNSMNEALSTNIFERRYQLLGLTYNNLGCVERQALNFDDSLKFLKQALQYESLLEKDGTDVVALNNTAGTIINICVVLSKLGKHDQALEYALAAIKKLRMTLKRYSEEINNNVPDQFTNVNNMAKTAVSAHFNAGVEFEYMRLWQEAQSQFEQAKSLAAIALDEQDPVHEKIKLALRKVNMQVRNKLQQSGLPKPFMVRVLSQESPRQRKSDKLGLRDLIEKLDKEYLQKQQPRQPIGRKIQVSPQHRLPWDFESNQVIDQRPFKTAKSSFRPQIMGSVEGQKQPLTARRPYEHIQLNPQLTSRYEGPFKKKRVSVNLKPIKTPFTTQNSFMSQRSKSPRRPFQTYVSHVPRSPDVMSLNQNLYFDYQKSIQQAIAENADQSLFERSIKKDNKDSIHNSQKKTQDLPVQQVVTSGSYELKHEQKFSKFQSDQQFTNNVLVDVAQINEQSQQSQPVVVLPIQAESNRRRSSDLDQHIQQKQIARQNESEIQIQIRYGQSQLAIPHDQEDQQQRKTKFAIHTQKQNKTKFHNIKHESIGNFSNQTQITQKRNVAPFIRPELLSPVQKSNSSTVEIEQIGQTGKNNLGKISSQIDNLNKKLDEFQQQIIFQKKTLDDSEAIIPQSDRIQSDNSLQTVK